MTMTRKTITISGAMEDWIKAQIECGRYGNDSEYVRDLIRRDQDYQARLSALRTAIENGRKSGETHDTVNDIIARGQAELDERL